MLRIVILSACIAIVYGAVFLFSGRTWPAAVAASTVALLSTLVVVAAAIRRTGSPRMRWAYAGTALLIIAIVLSDWFIATRLLARPTGEPSPRTTFMLHRLGSSSVLHHLGIHQLMKEYYAAPTRRPFGAFARDYLRRTGAAERMERLSDRILTFSFNASQDDALVVDVAVRRFPAAGPGNTPSDTTELHGRLILTAEGARYVIDR